jgi:cyclohexanone monooxygenase
VRIVSLKSTPITHFTPSGITTSDDVSHDLDVIIFATGFDAVDGNYTRVAIKGRQGKSLKQYWQREGGPGGPTTYLGVSVPEFPNMFMITGPNGPFTNIPPTIETHVEWIAELIGEAERRRGGGGKAVNGDGDGAGAAIGDGAGGSHVVEATKEAEDGWTTLCDELSKDSLFRKTDSWIFGANVPGKKNAVMFYFGGLGNYRKELDECRKNDYKGYKPF